LAQWAAAFDHAASVHTSSGSGTDRANDFAALGLLVDGEAALAGVAGRLTSGAAARTLSSLAGDLARAATVLRAQG
jgi:hypothetical protein